jgi:hypothetical protein|tara:strand:+ start:110 stop:355 length:246 start_codon:yes stop_codon:yes gene_type:complete
MNTAEFKIGDPVSFRAYKYQPEAGLKAKVVDVINGLPHSNRKHLDGSTDNRVFYVISGPDVVSTTSGISLIESKHYEEPTE